MSLFASPEEHAANPPESWHVTRRARGCWDLHVGVPGADESAGARLDSFPTRRAAEAAREAGWLVDLYVKEGRWYAGEPVAGWKPYKHTAEATR